MKKLKSLKKNNENQNLYALAIIIIETITFVLLPLTKLVPYISIWPLVFILAFTLLALYWIPSGENKTLKIISFLGIIVAIQVIHPVFTPEVTSLSVSEILNGKITTINDTEFHIAEQVMDIKIEPALFPIPPIDTITLPLGFSYLEAANYKEVFPLFSGLTVDKNTGRVSFRILADGWQFKELNAKIWFIGDKYPPFQTYFKEMNSNPSIITQDGNRIYSDKITIDNQEKFTVCFKDYIFNLQNSTLVFLHNTEKANYSVSLCDEDRNTCHVIHNSVNGKEFVYVLLYDDLYSEQLQFKLTTHLCMDGNSHKTFDILFRPL